MNSRKISGAENLIFDKINLKPKLVKRNSEGQSSKKRQEIGGRDLSGKARWQLLGL